MHVWQQTLPVLLRTSTSAVRKQQIRVEYVRGGGGEAGRRRRGVKGAQEPAGFVTLEGQVGFETMLQ